VHRRHVAPELAALHPADRRARERRAPDRLLAADAVRFESRPLASYDRHMPIYEYLCEGCGKVNEKLQKVYDPPPPRCDECGSRKLAKLVSRSAFQLKGGGWYSDLYASKKKEKAEVSKDGKDGAATTPATATEAKPSAKPEPATAAAAPPAPEKKEKKEEKKKAGASD
jgi:putative FmdB family regulatory protein